MPPQFDPAHAEAVNRINRQLSDFVNATILGAESPEHATALALALIGAGLSMSVDLASKCELIADVAAGRQQMPDKETQRRAAQELAAVLGKHYPILPKAHAVAAEELN